MLGAFKLNSISSTLPTAGVSATGGGVMYYTSGGVNYKIHNFTTVGNNNFVVSWPGNVDLLLVGGGGAGGGTALSTGGGGGGGGGSVVQQSSIAVTSQTYTIAIGAGGASTVGGTTNGGAGSSSTALTYTASGGGGGYSNAAAKDGGGSGATGSTSYTSTIGTYAYKGGNSFGSTTATSRAGGGGAGAGAAGTNAASATGGAGGAGLTINFDGRSQMYAPGGGGGGTTAGQSGLGSTATDGNGNGATNSSGLDQYFNYGGGGGGGRSTTASTTSGGNGYQGIASIKYVTQETGFIYYIDSNSTNTQNITIPSGIQAGDVAFYFHRARTGSTTIPTEAAPSGWTSMFNTSVGTSLGTRTVGYYKILSGSEGGTTLTGMSGGSAYYSSVVIYRKQGSSISSVSLSSVNSQSTDSALSNQTLTMTGVNKPFLGFALYTCSNGSSMPSFSSSTVESRNIFPTSSTNNLLKVFECGTSNDSISNSTISVGTDNGTNVLVSFTASIT